MKLAVIMPGEVSREIIESTKKQVSPGTEVAVLGAAKGLLEVAGDIELKGPQAAKLALQAERDGYDAVLLNGMCDFGLSLTRSAVNIPAVGAATATYNLVYQLVRSFGVVSVNAQMNPMFLRAVRECGCEPRMTSIRSMDRSLRIGVDGTELPYSPEQWEEEIITVARPQVEQEGAQCIVIACSMIFSILPQGARERMEETLGVMFVDPQLISIRTAEMLGALKLCHSKIEYPSVNSCAFDDF